MPQADPLILTAAFDEGAAGTFQRLRDQHFPTNLNVVPAHLTLFHHLAGEEIAAIAGLLGERCAALAPIGFVSAGFRFLGRGVAVEIAAPPLVALRRDLASHWADGLTAQDRQGFKPHVTIQNKTDPARARALLAHLQGGGLSVAGTVTGLRLWHYRGGPWDAAGTFAFAGAGA